MLLFVLLFSVKLVSVYDNYCAHHGLFSLQHPTVSDLERCLVFLLPFQDLSDCLPNLGGRILSQYTRIHYYLPQRRRFYGTFHLSYSRESQHCHLISNLCVYGDIEANPGPLDCMDFVPGRNLQVINETASDHVTSCSKADHSCVTATMPPLYYRSADLLNQYIAYSPVTLKALRGCRIQLSQQVLAAVHHLYVSDVIVAVVQDSVVVVEGWVRGGRSARVPVTIR